MHTYAFAFYLVKNNHVRIFEDNQKDLEQAIEQLSDYLERDIGEDDVTVLMRNVKDKATYCDKRRAALIAHIEKDEASFELKADLIKKLE